MHRIVLTLTVLGAATWLGTAAQAAHVNSIAAMDGSNIVLSRHSDAQWSYRSIEPIQLAEHCPYGYPYRRDVYYGPSSWGYPRHRYGRVYSGYPYGYGDHYGDGYHHHRPRHYYHYYDDHHHGGLGIHGSNASFWISF